MSCREIEVVSKNDVAIGTTSSTVKIGYVHGTIIDSYKLVDPVVDMCTNNVEAF